MNSKNWWARLGSNQRPADYESRNKPSATVRRRRSEYKTSTPASNKVRRRPAGSIRLAVKIGSQLCLRSVEVSRTPQSRRAASTSGCPRIFLRILLWMSRPFASRGQDLVDLAGDVALQATDDLSF